MMNDPLGTILLHAMAFGVLGVFVVALIERVVPFLPSYGLYAAIGMASAQGLICLSAAMLASVAGGAAGSLAMFGLGGALAKSGSRPGWRRSGYFALDRRRLVRLRSRARRHRVLFSFSAQLVPAFRFLAPGISGAAQIEPVAFLLASGAGILVWNGTFMGLGYVAARAGAADNATCLGLSIVLAFVAVAATMGLMQKLNKSASSPATVARGQFNGQLS